MKVLKSKFVQKWVAPIVRGAVKTLPGGSIAVELIQNFSKEEKPHHFLSITVQILGIAGIIYAFISKAITVDVFIELLKSL